MTDEQKNAIDHAQKILRAVKLYDHAALLSASIADTAEPLPVYQRAVGLDEQWVNTTKAEYENTPAHRRQKLYMRPVAAKSIADTAGANCATCGAVGTVTSTKARCTLCGMFADTAGAKPVALTPREAFEAWNDEQQDFEFIDDEAENHARLIFRAGYLAAPPAPSVAQDL